ncbi:MAG: histidine kinase [Bacteroidetes bacterium]|nr:histidine kinase [Bacteroidota bacterium]
MQWKLPQYSGKDYLVLSIFVGPFTLSINSLLLGIRYFADFTVSITASLVAAADFSIGFTLCSFIGVLLKRWFRKEEGIGLRLLIMILIFLVITAVFLLIIFRIYEHIPYIRYVTDKSDFVWACIGTGICVIFITFLLEGIDRYEIWKYKMNENEQLSRASRQSRLQGLKSQVNPHFLFNSLNSLSGLIQEDEEKAERFLDEMSKVYRYMLRNEETELVTLATELHFVDSYYYLLKTRYGGGLQISVQVADEDLMKWMPPLTLQTIIENAFTQNAMTRESPLHLCISSTPEGLVVRNNIQPKIIHHDKDIESGIDNLVTRYRFLYQSTISIRDNERERAIYLPLFSNNREAVR